MKILYIVNVDWFFISHRLPIALRAIKEGHKVHLACAITDQEDYLKSLGIKIHRVKFKRGLSGVLYDLKSIITLGRIIKTLKPDVCHCVTIKPVLYGGILSRICKVKKTVLAISGLGYVFINNNFKLKILRKFVLFLYKFAISKNTILIFQNNSDREFFTSRKLCDYSQTELIKGSGVDLKYFNFQPEKNGSMNITFLGRLLKDKGIDEFCRAAEIVLLKHDFAQFKIYGGFDQENPQGINIDYLKTKYNHPNITFYGHTTNVRDALRNSNIVVLPSYREGMPKILLEAAASGRAIITTDVPGCRDAIVNNQTGLLVEVKNVINLSNAMQNLICSNKLREEFGKNGRKYAERNFDINEVVKRHVNIYER